MTPEEAEERLKRRQATAARAQERRQAAQERRSQAAAERKGAAAAAADAKASAASRVTNWAEGKDFFGMLQTLDAFGKLNLSTGVGTSRALEPGATPAAIKKAFHKASLSLHPDRLTALEPAQQIEAEELFKVLSAAFDVVRQQQAVTLQA